MQELSSELREVRRELDNQLSYRRKQDTDISALTASFRTTTRAAHPLAHVLSTLQFLIQEEIHELQNLVKSAEEKYRYLEQLYTGIGATNTGIGSAKYRY